VQLKRKDSPRIPSDWRIAMTSDHHALNSADDADLAVDEWTLDDFDAIDDLAEFDSVRSSIAALDAFDD
jgi:hypothetical protein